ncbi:tetratricopeptide repeat protein [Streptomyces longwoodensis]|uniref:tetratricopeptide repeat protein n=1 Tax=Streptomyces longwoodensis TaxID=68231 RepID=UPI003245D3D8
MSRYEAAVAEAVRQYGPEAIEALAIRHQLAHWTGESGHPEHAVQLFARLLADRERLQGPHHPDSELARHQLAHWYGRAGRFQEAVNRYEIMRRVAVQQGHTETALSMMCEVGYWQHQAGDTAAALRTFAEMLRGAQQELGPTHQLTGIARQRYAELAGDLPFGNEGGHDGLQNLIAAAAEVEASGDFRRAGRLYGQIAAQSEDLYGHASAQTLSALVAQAKAAVNAGDHAEAAERFDAVLTCMALQGAGRELASTTSFSASAKSSPAAPHASPSASGSTPEHCWGRRCRPPPGRRAVSWHAGRMPRTPRVSPSSSTRRMAVRRSRSPRSSGRR